MSSVSDAPRVVPEPLLSQMERAVLAHPSVADAAILPVGAAETRAFVVPAGPLTSETIESALSAAGLDPTGIQVTHTPITSIPLTGDGAVDAAALLELPIVDEGGAQRWESTLRTGGLDVAVLVEEAPRVPRPFHLDELVPEWDTTSSTPTTIRIPSNPADDPRIDVTRSSLCQGEPILAPLPANLGDALHRAVTEWPEHGVRYLDWNRAAGEGSVTEEFQSYPELQQDAFRILKGLQEAGLRRGDWLLLQLERNRDFIASTWACLLGGIVAVPVTIAPTYASPNSTLTKLQGAWEMLGHPPVLTGDSLLESVRNLETRMGMTDLRVLAVGELRAAVGNPELPAIHGDDVALLLLTSGSTGQPKGVPLVHRNILARSFGTAQRHEMGPGDISLNWFPLDHVGGIVMFHLRDVCTGAQQIHAPTELVLDDPLRWLEWVDRYRVTLTWAPNFAYGLINDRAEAVAAARWDLSSLRFILNAGEAIVSKTTRRFLELLEPHGLPATAMKPSWGMSETSSAVTFSQRFTRSATSDDDPFVEVGAPIPGFAFRIVEAGEVEGRVLPEGAIGRLEVRGLSVHGGYFRPPTGSDPNEGAFSPDGWFKTGDLGVVRDGQLSITGREKDIIIINGVNFYSHEIEAVVEEVPGVEVSFTAACAVRPGGVDTDKVAVFFHPSDPDPDELPQLIRDIRAQVVTHAGINPEFVVPVSREDVPKTAIGKIQRAQLRKRFEAGEFAAATREIEIRSGGPATVPAWFYRRIWRHRARPCSSPTGGPLVLFSARDRAGGEGFSPQRTVVRVFAGSEFSQEAGPSPQFTVRPGVESDLRALLDQLRSDFEGSPTWVDLWALDDPGASLRHLVAVARVLAAAEELQQAVRVVVVTAGAPPELAALEGRPSERQAALAAAARTLPREHPWMDVRQVDVDPSDPEWFSQVLAEADSTRRDLEVAYRAGQRRVPRLEPVQPGGSEPVFRRGGRYLVAGGLGSVGRRIVEHLLRRYEAGVTIIGRSPQSGPATETLRTLQSLPGSVNYVSLDVTASDFLARLSEAAPGNWDGVIHLAGGTHHGVVTEEGEAGLMRATERAERSTRNLLAVAQRSPSSIFVAFGHASQILGSAAMGAANVASAVTESLIRQASDAPDHAGTHRRYFLSWSLWDGSAAGAAELARAGGGQVVPTREGLFSLEAALRGGEPALAIGLDESTAAVGPLVERPAAAVRRWVALLAGGAAERREARSRDWAGQGRFPGRWVSVSSLPRLEDGRYDLTQLRDLARQGRGGKERVELSTDSQREIAAIWQEVLGVPRVSANDNFFDLGGHSLLATQVISRLRKSFPVDLSLRHLFEFPTLCELAGAIEEMQVDATGTDDLSELLSQLEGLSDEEVQLLLAGQA